MRYPKTTGTTPTLPTYSVDGDVPAFYQNSVSPSTHLDVDCKNMIQQELVNAIVDQGVDIDPTKDNQLSTVLNAIKTSRTASVAVNGWKKDSETGIIEQWGRSDGTPANTSITFPIPFPNECFNIQVTTIGPGSGSALVLRADAVTKTGFKTRGDSWFSPQDNTTGKFWRAIGH